MLSTLWQLNAHEARFIGFSIFAPTQRNTLYQFREIYSSTIEKYLSFLTEIYFVGYIRSSICSALEKSQQLSPLLSCSRSSGCGGGGQMIFQIHPFYIFFFLHIFFTLFRYIVYANTFATFWATKLPSGQYILSETPIANSRKILHRNKVAALLD